MHTYIHTYMHTYIQLSNQTFNCKTEIHVVDEVISSRACCCCSLAGRVWILLSAASLSAHLPRRRRLLRRSSSPVTARRHRLEPWLAGQQGSARPAAGFTRQVLAVSRSLSDLTPPQNAAILWLAIRWSGSVDL